MPYYFGHDIILLESYYQRHIRRRIIVRDQLVVPQQLTSLVLHARHDHILSGGHCDLNQPLINFDRDTGDPLYLEMRKDIIETVKHVREGRLLIVVLHFLLGIFLLSALIDDFWSIWWNTGQRLQRPTGFNVNLFYQ